METIKQPKWCNYPKSESFGDATTPCMGCWSLLSGYIKKEEDCKEYDGEWCECHIDIAV